MKAYDHLADAYSRVFDWENRLKREEPFFQHLFHEHMVKSLLDLGCGTGKHAMYWAEIGCNVVGVDSSPGMIAEARRLAETGDVDVEFECHSITNYARELEQQFDAVICLGNTLPHVLEPESLRQFFAEMARVLKLTGVGIIQLQNYRRIMDIKKRDLPVLSHRDENGDETIFCRFYDFLPHCLEFNMVLACKRDEEWHSHSSQVYHYPWMHDDLMVVAKQEGFGEIMCYSDFEFSEFDADESETLILVLQKGEFDD